LWPPLPQCPPFPCPFFPWANPYVKNKPSKAKTAKSLMIIIIFQKCFHLNPKFEPFNGILK
jgi:hypothetical protein